MKKMNSTPARFFLIITVILAFLCVKCSKELSEENGGLPLPSTPDLVTTVQSSVSGFVTGDNDVPVIGAVVKVGAQFIVTDKYGYFEIKNEAVVKNAATVTVSSPGFFPGIRTYIAEANKSAFVRIQLIPKTNTGNFSANSGGTVSTSNGLKITLPATAVVNASTGNAYSGVVNVAAFWIDPTATNMDRLMPGDLRALDTSGAIKQLTSYGMAAVELTGSAGEKLQVASGKKATVSFPIPASIQSTAPTSIPLWYFDEAIGLWKEEGSAIKTGSNYDGQVSHFSFWNCDVPANFIQFNCTIKDNNGEPVPFVYAKITRVNNANSSSSGYTDSSGYVAGAVPKNEQLRLDLFTNNGCSVPFYTQTFTTTTTNISLGVITVNLSQGIATVSGTVTTCSNTPATNGFIIMKKDNHFFRYNLSSSGAFNFTSPLCNNTSTSVQLIAEDVSASQQSLPAVYTIVPGNNAIGNIQACGVTTQQFLNISINGTNHSFTAPTDSLTLYNSGGSNLPPTTLGLNFYAYKTSPTYQTVSFRFNGQGINVGTSQALINFNTNIVTDSFTIPTPINVNITEYGAIGQFISGNYTGLVRGAAPLNTAYNIICSFRVRRYN